MQMQGAVFDLDGVITDTAKYHFAAWSKLAKETWTSNYQLHLKLN